MKLYFNLLIFLHLQGDRTTWEYHTVILYRVAGYGFGIAGKCHIPCHNYLINNLKLFLFLQCLEVVTIRTLQMEILQ